MTQTLKTQPSEIGSFLGSEDITVASPYVRIEKESSRDAKLKAALVEDSQRELKSDGVTYKSPIRDDQLLEPNYRYKITLQFPIDMIADISPESECYTLVSEVDLSENWIQFKNVPKKIFLLGCDLSLELKAQCYESGDCKIYYLPPVREASPDPSLTVGDATFIKNVQEDPFYSPYHNFWHECAANVLGDSLFFYAHTRTRNTEEFRLIVQLQEYTGKYPTELIRKMLHSYQRHLGLHWYSKYAPFCGLKAYDIAKLLRYRSPLEISLLMGVPFMSNIMELLLHDRGVQIKTYPEIIRWLKSYSEEILSVNPTRRTVSFNTSK